MVQSTNRVHYTTLQAHTHTHKYMCTRRQAGGSRSSSRWVSECFSAAAGEELSRSPSHSWSDRQMEVMWLCGKWAGAEWEGSLLISEAVTVWLCDLLEVWWQLCEDKLHGGWTDRYQSIIYLSTLLSFIYLFACSFIWQRHIYPLMCDAWVSNSGPRVKCGPQCLWIWPNTRSLKELLGW